MVALTVFALFFGTFIGYCWGNSKRGKLVEYTNELPNGFLRILSTDKTSSVLEEVDYKKRRFLVSTDVFGGKPIRPKDVVRKIKSDRERKDFGIPVLGYPPLIKVEEEDL
ncbi:MAG: hypothetical protein WC908_00550 [Candidatus Paceibacterota bacterium]